MGILDNLKNVLGGRRKEPGADDGKSSPAGTTSADTPESHADSLPYGKAAEQAEATTYTVQSGDTLWKIAKEHYGDGDQYMRIFEANRGVLDSPDHIEPGQELNIPPNTD